MPWRNPKNETDCKDEAFNFPDVVEQAQALVNKAKFSEPAKWNKALKNGNAYALVAVLLSQLHNLEALHALHLDYQFIWKSGFPGLMLKHALFTAPEGMLSTFNSLVMVDYGSNVPESETIDGYFVGPGETEGFPSCDPKQFMAWFHLPAVESLAIWLRSFQNVITCEDQGNLFNLHTLVVTRSTINEEVVPELLSQSPGLRTLRLGMAFEWQGRCSWEYKGSILEGLFGSVVQLKSCPLAGNTIH